MLPNSKIETIELFNSIYTTAELQLFYKEVDQLVSLLFKGSQPVDEIMQDLLSPEKKENLLSYLQKSNIDLKNPVVLQEELLKIKKLGNNLPVIHLTLAFEPTTAILKNINLWFLRRLQKKVLLDIVLERTVLGGAFISFDGLYKDYTLKTKIDTYFDKKINLQEHITKTP